MTDIITKFLANLLDKLKVSSPILYTIVVILIWGLLFAVQQGVLVLPENVGTYLLPILTLILAGISPRTTRYVQEQKGK